MERGQRLVISSGAQWQDKSKQAQTETQKVSPEFQKHAFHCEGWLSTGTCYQERSWSLNSWRYSKAVWEWCCTRHLLALLEQRGWTKLPLRMPPNLNNSVIFTNVVYEKFAVFRWFKSWMFMQLQCRLRRIWLFWLRQSPFTNTRLFRRLKCLLRSCKRWIRLRWVYLSCSASHILLAHCMLH